LTTFLTASDIDASSCLLSGTRREKRWECSSVDLEGREGKETEYAGEELDVRVRGERASEESVLDTV
jgi:hypothetical protein